ncbi:MAG: hypothetical protein BTN85_0226 [Candidatus Methanohalarchaeum thermophilum]|uniref:Uncharacterized protein n=1 Tax=Methanohalarchaeum thermophilum TaxID=1903181 RepID=A0A1Q6DTT6_METT1|nr:MAG: hypothetical protein BTN85_0226 [Candidatus Methanohalarchaeum thermophilum]
MVSDGDIEFDVTGIDKTETSLKLKPGSDNIDVTGVMLEYLDDERIQILSFNSSEVNLETTRLGYNATDDQYYYYNGAYNFSQFSGFNVSSDNCYNVTVTADVWKHTASGNHKVWLFEPINVGDYTKMVDVTPDQNNFVVTTVNNNDDFISDSNVINPEKDIIKIILNLNAIKQGNLLLNGEDATITFIPPVGSEATESVIVLSTLLDMYITAL